MSFLIRNMQIILLHLNKINQKQFTIRRTITSGKSLLKNYEGDGKTIVTMLNRENSNILMINSFSNYGFRLNNGIFVVGPVAVFPRTVLQWNVNSVADLSPETLSLFCLLEPKIDILVLGTGDKKQFLSKAVLELLKDHKIVPEIFNTENAVSVFNFLNVEGRCVAGGFILPDEVQIYGEELKLITTVEDPPSLIPIPKSRKHE